MSAPSHLSYSSFTTLTECGEKFRLTRVLQIPEDPAWYFLGGTAVHTATERFDLGGYGYPDSDLFAVAFEEEIEKAGDISRIRAAGRPSKDWPNGEDRAWWEKHGQGFVNAWIKFRDDNPSLVIAEFNDTPAVEVDVMADLNGILLKGFIDRVFVDIDTGQLLIVDLKTGRNTPPSALQLSFYKVALAETVGVTADFGAFWMARQGHLSRIEELWQSRELVEDWLRKARHMIDNEIFIPHVTPFCNSCGVKDFCSAFRK